MPHLAQYSARRARKLQGHSKAPEITQTFDPRQEEITENIRRLPQRPVYIPGMQPEAARAFPPQSSASDDR